MDKGENRIVYIEQMSLSFFLENSCANSEYAVNCG
jgi:hypothetical protein